MNMKSLSTIFLVALCFFILPLTYEANAQTNKVGRSSRQSKVRKSQQWEYCVVSLSNTTTTGKNEFIGQAVISYLDKTNKADVRIEVTDSPTDNSLSRRKALVKAFAQLGDEGWELVGSFPFSYDFGFGDSGFFFIRRKQ